MKWIWRFLFCRFGVHLWTGWVDIGKAEMKVGGFEVSPLTTTQPVVLQEKRCVCCNKAARRIATIRVWGFE